MNKLLLFFICLCIISILLHKDNNTLLLIILLSIIFLIYLNHFNTLHSSNIEKDTKILPKTSNNYKIEHNKTILKYLDKEPELKQIIENIRFIKRYDPVRYADLLNLGNSFNKTYIFMMSDRWDIKHFLPILKDLRKDILENLYSIYIIIPKKTKHTFGFEPYKELEKTIENFNNYSKKKLEIVKRYGIDYKGIKNMIETRIDGYNEREKFISP
tara:strand:+ start:898 stop:1539 length:642 start_codon:yes stop_codon:yes gene_type:complete